MTGGSFHPLLCSVSQTQPLYLAQLIFLMPQSRSTSFMEMLVFSLFNYGSDRREAFLLLQLFTEALRYEIRYWVWGRFHLCAGVWGVMSWPPHG